MPHVVCIGGVSVVNTSFCHILSVVGRHFGYGTIPVRLPVNSRSAFGNVVSLMGVGTVICCSSVNGSIESRTVPSSVLRLTGGCHAGLIRAVIRRSRTLVRGCFRNRRPAIRRVGGVVHGTAVTGSVMPVYYNASCHGGNMRPLLSTIISCVPTPASVRTVGNMGPSASRRRIERSASDRPFTTLTFGVTASPFMNGVYFFHMCSNSISTNTNMFGSIGHGGREVKHVLRVRTGRHRSVRAYCSNSVTTTINLGGAAANSALYSRGGPVVLRSVGFPRPIVHITVRPGAGTNRRGVNLSLTGLTRRSPAFGTCASRRANRAVVTNVNRLRLRVVISHLLHRFGMRTGINTPRITCGRDVHRFISRRAGCGHRSNNSNRCNRIGVGLRPGRANGNCRFVGTIANNDVPGRCVPTISANVGNSLRTNMLTNCPMISIGIALCSNSCRRISSCRVTFGVTNSVTFGRTYHGTGPILLRPVVGIAIVIPRRCVNSIVNSLGSHHNRVRNFRSHANIGRVGTHMPLNSVFNCTASLHSGARNHNRCMVRPSNCGRIPGSVTRGVVSSHAGGSWLALRVWIWV